MLKLRTKFSNYTILATALQLSIHFTSCQYGDPCGEERTPVNTYYVISEANRTSIPFRADGKDTLTYISDAGDTAVLYGIGTKQIFERNVVRRESDPDCPEYDYDYCENIEYSFEGSNTKLLNSITFKMYFWRINEGSTYKELGSFTFNKVIKTTKQSLALGDIPDDLLAGLRDINLYTAIVDIQGTKYNGMSIFNSQNSDTLLIYNKNFGILQIQLNNQLWKLNL